MNTTDMGDSHSHRSSRRYMLSNTRRRMWPLHSTGSIRSPLSDSDTPVGTKTGFPAPSMRKKNTSHSVAITQALPQLSMNTASFANFHLPG